MNHKNFTTLEIPQEIIDLELNLCKDNDLEIVQSYSQIFIKKSLDEIGLYKVLNEIVFDYYNFALCGCCGISSAGRELPECLSCSFACKWGDHLCTISGLEKYWRRDFEAYVFNSYPIIELL